MCYADDKSWRHAEVRRIIASSAYSGRTSMMREDLESIFDPTKERSAFFCGSRCPMFRSLSLPPTFPPSPSGLPSFLFAVCLPFCLSRLPAAHPPQHRTGLAIGHAPPCVSMAPRARARSASALMMVRSLSTACLGRASTRSMKYPARSTWRRAPPFDRVEWSIDPRADPTPTRAPLFLILLYT